MGDEVELEIFDPDLLSGSEDEEDVHQEEALLGVDEVSGNFNSASNKVPNLGIIPKRSQWDHSADMVPIPILPPSLKFLILPSDIALIKVGDNADRHLCGFFCI